MILQTDPKDKQPLHFMQHEQLQWKHLINIPKTVLPDPRDQNKVSTWSK